MYALTALAVLQVHLYLAQNQGLLKAAGPLVALGQQAMKEGDACTHDNPG